MVPGDVRDAPGCRSGDFGGPAATTIDVLALLNPFSEADGLTVSGGEPRAQPMLWARS